MRSFGLGICFATFTSLTFVACGEDSGASRGLRAEPDRGDSCTGSGASVSVAPPGVDAGPCNAVENTGKPVQPIQVATPVPVGTGGTLPPNGLYLATLTAENIYTGVGGPTGPTGEPTHWVGQALLNSATPFPVTSGPITFQIVESTGTGPDSHSTRVIDLPAKLLTQTCPLPGFATPFDYTLDGLNFHMIVGNIEYVYSASRAD